jgi:hypothetical protein
MLDRETGMEVFALVATQLSGRRAGVPVVHPPRRVFLARRFTSEPSWGLFDDVGAAALRPQRP